MNDNDEILKISEQFQNFEIEYTDDSSPTLRLNGQGESMHHSAGALTETVYIYSNPFAQLLNVFNEKSIQMCVVGLGLGYIELCCLVEWIKKIEKNKNNLTQSIVLNIDSFELDLELKQKLFNWIKKQTIHNTSSSVLSLQTEKEPLSIYHLIFQLIGKNENLNMNLDHFRYFLKENIQMNIQLEKSHDSLIEVLKNNVINIQNNLNAYNILNWNLKGPLEAKPVFSTSLNNKDDSQISSDLVGHVLKNKYHFVAYDAFSQKTDHPLWTEEFLNDFIQNQCAAECLWVTYACTGVLRRALIANGFTFIKKPGLKGKRDSTFAYRGLKGMESP